VASITDDLKAEAHRLGFDLVGVALPLPAPHLQVYEQWLQAGRHAQMTYLESAPARERRADLRRILPEVRSVLSLGVRYPAPAQPFAADAGSPRGRVAAYSWGEDYHEALPGRLQALVAFLEHRLGRAIPNRWYTDTGPILERDYAQLAGLGWIGKNTCLIHPRLGSYFLLAEILLGIDLEPDAPFAAPALQSPSLPAPALPGDLCGACTRCIEACPTQCILPDRTLDAGRCISYLTIELKGAIPLELRPQMGDWVFGCDICQQVCPWNLRFAAPQGDPAFAPRLDVPAPDLIQELSLTPETFNRKFKRSPVKRARRRGYLRNVCVALGNAGDPDAISALGKVLLEEAEPLVRGHAAWALGQIGGLAAQGLLRQALESEPEAAVRAEIEAALV
jgi:epoxyqueuosine reductase